MTSTLRLRLRHSSQRVTLIVAMRSKLNGKWLEKGEVEGVLAAPGTGRDRHLVLRALVAETIPLRGI